MSERRHNPGSLLEELCAALRAAYDLQMLEQLLRFKLDKELDDLVAAGAFQDVVFHLVERAQREGWLPELVQAAAADRPDNPSLAGLGQPMPPGPPPPFDPDTLPDPGALPLGSRLPFLRNPLFTGRERDLFALAAALVPAQADHRAAPEAGAEAPGAAPKATLLTQVLAGMGGIGKTQVAVEFAWRLGTCFRGVHWINAAQPDLLDAEVADCGAAMDLPGWPREQPEQVNCTLAAWRAAGPRLVVLDNLEDVAAARKWLPRLAAPTLRLLLTARRAAWPRDLGLRALPLDLFTAAESRDFLRRALPQSRAGDAELDALAARLGRLPLALQLAARYLDAHPRLAPPAFLAELDELLAHPAFRGFMAELGDPVGHDLSLRATFFHSWRRIEDEAARRLFLVAGHCAPNQPVPPALLERAAGLDQSACDEAVTLLAAAGLLAVDDPQRGPTFHPLLAEYARSVPPASPQAPGDAAFSPLAALAAALAPLCYDANMTGLPTAFFPLRPHLEAAAPAAEAAGLWNSLGYHLKMVAAYGSARACFERALRIDEAALGPDHPSVAIRVNNLGAVLKALGDLPAAHACFERALRIGEAALSPDHPNVARDVNNLGAVLKDLGDLPAARACFERALRIDEAALGPDHPKVARDVNNLGAVLRALGDLPAARACFERALRIFEKTLPRAHPNIQIVRGHLAALDRLAAQGPTLRPHKDPAP